MQLRGLAELKQQAYLNNVGKFGEFYADVPGRSVGPPGRKDDAGEDVQSLAPGNGDISLVQVVA